MLHFVGIGLRPEHMSQHAIQVARSCDTRYVDAYTTPVPEHFLQALEQRVGDVVLADRSMLEDKARAIMEEAREKDVCLLVWGDPFVATTHVSLRLLAEEQGVNWSYVPGISVIQVVPSILGLQHYRFGKVITIPKEWARYTSWLERYEENRRMDAHTLFLLDIGLSIHDALRALRGHADLVAVVARATWEDERICAGSPEDLLSVEWGPPPYTLVVPGTLHPIEEEAMKRWMYGRRRRNTSV